MMHDIRFHVSTPVARTVELQTTSHYPSAPADSAAPIEVTDLAWTNVTAIECSVATARIVIADIEQARSQSDDAAFRASCTAAIDAIEMAILDSAPRAHQSDVDMRTIIRAPHAGDDARRDR